MNFAKTWDPKLSAGLGKLIDNCMDGERTAEILT